MRVSKTIREAANEVREGEARYPSTTRDPYNLGLYLWDLPDQEVILHLRDTANAIARLTDVQRRALKEQAKASAKAPKKKRERESRSPTPPRRYKAKPCSRCIVHNNRALANAHGRKPSPAEWALWHLDNPKHSAKEALEELAASEQDAALEEEVEDLSDEPVPDLVPEAIAKGE